MARSDTIIEKRLTTVPSIQQDRCSGNGTLGRLIESSEAVKPAAQVGQKQYRVWSTGLFEAQKPSQIRRLRVSGIHGLGIGYFKGLRNLYSANASINH